MNHPFEVGEIYRNRNGRYEVLVIEEPQMRIRYEDGSEHEVTIDIQTHIWQAMIDEELPRKPAISKSRKKQRKPPRYVTIAEKDKIRKVMTYKSVPAGQMRLYKAIWDRKNRGLTFTELAGATHGDIDEARSTLGALGNRVQQALGDQESSRLVIEHWSDDRYYLSPAMMAYIEATPSFKEALETSEQGMFDRRTPTAWNFSWNEDKQSGYLREFTRSKS